MISRRLIRIKALQILYAASKKKEISSTSAEKELFHSVEKYYDLYHLLILLIVEMVELEIKNNDFKRSKKAPTVNDLNPDLGLQDNLLVEKLRNNIELVNYLDKRKLSWKIHKDFIKQVYSDFTNSQIYAEFIELEERSFKVDRELTVRFYSEFLAENERFVDFLEEENIYWNDDYSFVLVMVIKTIRNLNSSSTENMNLLPLFKNDDDREFAKLLLRKTIVNKSEYTKIIEKHTKNWDTERIAQIDLLIMQLAIAEIMEFESIPIKVSLNEYIEISKYYSTVRSKTFINGLLDKIVKSLNDEKKVNKTGRGLN
ncbi:MAG: transcription antitermination factor NusB [Bacteroidota bacterium]